MKKTAIITGVTGQAGSYFAEFLLAKGIRVVGAVRRLSVPNNSNIHQIKDENFILELIDLGDSHSIERLINKYKPDYYINCAANSFVGTSWDCPEQHFEFNTLGVLRELECIRKYSPSTRYVNFGSSEEFGDVIYSPQDEKHPARARSPYGASKVAARQITKVWKESYNLYAVQCWCFNYESPRRGEEFITRKITKGIARIKNAIKNNQPFEPIELGNIYAQRDWSHAKDMVEGVWRLLNQEKFNDELLKKLSGYPIYLTKEDRKGAERHLTISQDIKALSKEIKDYVFSSGQTHTVKEFADRCFKLVGIEGKWEGILQSLDEKFVSNGKTIIKINPKFYRPAEVKLLLGSSELAKKELGWEPKISFDELIKEMVIRDLADYNISLD